MTPRFVFQLNILSTNTAFFYCVISKNIDPICEGKIWGVITVLTLTNSTWPLSELFSVQGKGHKNHVFRVTQLTLENKISF